MSEGTDYIDMDERPPTSPSHDDPVVYRPRGNMSSSVPLPMSHPPDSGDATPVSPTTQLFGPAVASPTPSPRPRPIPLTSHDVTSWWGSRDSVRQWKDKDTSLMKRSLPPDQEDRWKYTKVRVNLALRSTIGYTLDATHDALEMGGNLLRFAPVPGLDEAAHVLLSIWDALQQVDTNKLACLRLTERCAEILLAVRAEVHEAGDKVGEELTVPLDRLSNSFRSVHILLQKQVHRPFIKRYLKRDEITRNINGCDAELKDALDMFSLSIQLRTLKQILIIEHKRQDDNERILAALLASGVELDKTPKHVPTSFPETLVRELSPVTHDSQIASGSRTTSESSTSPIGPPPSPHEMKLLSAAQPTPDIIKTQLQTIVAAQNEADRAMDMEDLRCVLREALATANDADIIRLLQVRREDMPEAIKTLQRAFETCIEHEHEHQREEVREPLEQVPSLLYSNTEPTSTNRSPTPGATSSERRQMGPLSNLRRRFTSDNKSGKLGRRGSARVQHFEGSTLDKEFIESGIDALRRLSTGQDLTLPSWTITRYEVDLEEKIGVGFFSDVYKAIWRNRMVAVKVLSNSTPRKLFLKEMAVWKKLDHPNVLPLYGASSARGDPPWFFVSPYMKYGNIVMYLRRSHKQVDSFTHKRMIHEIATGMEYLHSKDITHGDLKGTNVLIDDSRHCVISDFGQSDMKSEAYRISGFAPAQGAVRWRAPEQLDGISPGRPSPQADVYSFAIVCIEILGQGALPWPMLDDEDVRALILLENKRPVLPNSSSSEIVRVISMCWAREPQARPSFSTIITELQKSGVSKFIESPSLSMSRAEAWNSGNQFPSPDIKPRTPLPIVEILPIHENQNEHGSSLASTNTSELTTTTGSYHTAATTIIPVQRIITPIREDDKQASPVEYKPIKMPESHPTTLSHTDTPPSSSLLFSAPGSQPESQISPEELLYPMTHSIIFPDAPAHSGCPTAAPQRSNTIATASTTTTESKDSEDITRAGPGISKHAHSPIPVDEQLRQMKNEKRYRLNLQHDFNPSLKLGLWDPTPVELGAVGYLDKRQGRFITLLNAFDPVASSCGRAKGMPTLYGYGTVSRGEQRQGRNVAQRGLDLIQGLLPFVNKNGQFSQSVSRRYSFPIHAGRRSAHLCTEFTRYNYIVDQRLESPKNWFSSNIKSILKIYGKEHGLQKEDVYLVIGTLCAQDYALFVNHNRPDGQVHFNVFTSPKARQDWGVFSTDVTLPFNASGGPDYSDFHEEEPVKYWTANKVSQVNPGRPWDAVLLARLRFKPDNDVPTSL